MPRVTHVKKAQKEIKDYDGKTLIAVGESYYWWKFRFGGKQVSKTYPKPQQLTQSAYLQSVYGIQEAASFSVEDICEGCLDDIISQVEEIRDQCQESLDNMPEHLQESSSSGELLQERIDNCESVGSDLESIDCTVEKKEEKEEVIEQIEDALQNF